MSIPLENDCLVNETFFDFISHDVLPLTRLKKDRFWSEFNRLICDLAPKNAQLLRKRQVLQNQIDDWHKSRQGQKINLTEYKKFLFEIGYLVPEPENFNIETKNVDVEIASIAGPQLVVPLKNSRFTLNAANARWGSLYDAFYGTDIIPKTNGLKPGKQFNEARAKRVIAKGRNFLDEIFPLAMGSHHDVVSYLVYYRHLLAIFPDGTECGLKKSNQFVAYSGSKSQPYSILLKNNGLHVEIQFDPSGKNGKKDMAGIDDILMEAAITTIVDCEDSVAAVDSEDKIEVYRNWLGLILGDLTAKFDKSGREMTRKLNRDRVFTSSNGEDYRLHGRSLLLNRNVGHLMDCDLMQDALGNFVPEGLIDAVVTTLIASLDLQKNTLISKRQVNNSRKDSIYIVKPKMHGPEEVAFTCELFSRVESLLDLPENTIKLGIMDEERRTTLNLKACIYAAKERVVFINTGFLDRTGDEIHTSMHAGPFYPKKHLKTLPWISAYENQNVDIGIQCGLPGKAQIGKGMWPMPDEVNQMLMTKIEHPEAGANTAWVPSPTSAVVHAIHYHRVDVFARQESLKQREMASIDDILSIPVMDGPQSLSTDEVGRELENNIQGILGYVVRWVELGIGCSKVPDMNDIGLMEDRATLRISSQHIANWLLHGVCTKDRVIDTLQRMAKVVDEQNAKTPGYIKMSDDYENSLAFQAAKELIFTGVDQPSGYTEPVLHRYRNQVKARNMNQSTDKKNIYKIVKSHSAN